MTGRRSIGCLGPLPHRCGAPSWCACPDCHLQADAPLVTLTPDEFRAAPEARRNARRLERIARGRGAQ